MASEDSEKLNLKENFEWNVENEIKLFEAMIGHKPVGINKHFHMACISEKFESLLGKQISSDVLWQHLESMYDLTALDKKETLPFPNEPDEFSLPEDEYSYLINEKLMLKCDQDDTKDNKESNSSLKNQKELTPAKEAAIKKEKKTDSEDFLNNDADKKDISDMETESQKGKLGKEIKTRGKRNVKDKKVDLDSSASSTISKKEENPSTFSANKKDKQTVGKRTLRSRADDLLPIKSVTPPPSKRARRF